MPLNLSGAISLGGTTPGQSIAIENGGPGTATISLNDTAVRNLAGPSFTTPASTIIMPTNFYGKSNRVSINLTISANTFNYDIYANRSPAYVAGQSDITVTVNPGVYVGGNNPGLYAMLVPSAFNAADTVRIVNNGYLLGAGGNGGQGGFEQSGNPTFAGLAGATGGNALYVNRSTTVTNNGFIYSGGGGGGGTPGGRVPVPSPKGPNPTPYSGGSGGGGAGYNAGSGVGPLGPPGQPGSSSPGGLLTGGAGGSAVYGGTGGTGGAAGSNGAAGGAPGGSTGFYIVGNSFVTWPATGTRGGNVA